MSTVSITTRQTWIMLIVFVLIVVFAIYNVLSATNDRNDLLKANNKLLKQGSTLENETSTLARQNHVILLQLAEHEAMDRHILKDIRQILNITATTANHVNNNTE